MPTGSRIWTGLVLGSALLGLVGCRAFDPAATQAANRIPPPPTGSYAIPNGTARNTAEPYYARPTESSSENAATSAPANGTTSRSGSWYSTGSGTGSTAAPTSAATSPIQDSAVQPASFRSATAPNLGNRAVDLSQLLPVETTVPPGVELGDGTLSPENMISPETSRSEVAAEAAETRRSVDELLTEPQRLRENMATPLPTEAGAIGSGVKPTVPSTPLPSSVPGRVSAGSTTLPTPLTPADLTSSGSTSWRPRFGG